MRETISELFRRIENIAEIGTICDIKPGQSIAKVAIGEAVTDWSPVLQLGNDRIKVFSPPVVGEQVLFLCPESSDLANGVIIRGIYHRGLREPEGAENADVIEFASGAKIKHEEGKIEISGSKEINITSDKAKIQISGDCELKAQAVKVDAEKIELGKGGLGVVTGETVCPFTGNPHFDFSTKVTAIKT